MSLFTLETRPADRLVYLAVVTPSLTTTSGGRER